RPCSRANRPASSRRAARSEHAASSRSPAARRGGRSPRVNRAPNSPPAPRAPRAARRARARSSARARAGSAWPAARPARERRAAASSSPGPSRGGNRRARCRRSRRGAAGARRSGSRGQPRPVSLPGRPSAERPLPCESSRGCDMKTLVPILAAAVAALALAGAARAGLSQQRTLAERYAPVVRLVAGSESCGPDSRYVPIDVNLLFGEPTVALRGAWGDDLVGIGPTAKELGRGLYGYPLDFPGNALQPDCDYLHWQQHLGAERTPTTYAHVATDPAHPGKLALQYWVFYVFNDWNNLHEGDWEMIQLVFDAPTVEAALQQPPVEVGFSQHEGA